MLTPIQKQILRSNLLRQLQTVRSGLPIETLLGGVELGGFNIPESLVIEALNWLIRKGFAEETCADFSDVVRIWKITDAGVAFLDK